MEDIRMCATNRTIHLGVSVLSTLLGVTRVAEVKLQADSIFSQSMETLPRAASLPIIVIHVSLLHLLVEVGLMLLDSSNTRQDFTITSLRCACFVGVLFQQLRPFDKRFTSPSRAQLRPLSWRSLSAAP